MKNASSASWSVILLMALGAMAALLSGCDSFVEGYNKSFKESYVREFGPACTKGAVAQGAPEAKAKAICECMGKYLVDHHTPTELTMMSARTETPESKRILNAAMNACTK